MSQRDKWRQVLEAETRYWSSMSCEQLINELREVRVYEVERGPEKYQVEVQLLENTPAYIHVAIAVDDGSLPASIVPLAQTFTREKCQGQESATH